MNDETAVIAKVPGNEGLSAELAAAAPRKWWNKGTVGLGVAALLLGGFLGGVQAQKQWGPSSAATAGGFPSGGGGMRGGGGFGQQPQSTTSEAATSGTTGKVKLVNGKTIYVETEDGTVVTVKTDGSTTISTASKGKLSDVKAGQSVTVQGEAADDGTVTAKSVTATK
ncbi:hypothetical protein [Actinoplanes campanulatus]|nr:hypothetical protein [Actinoplanes campanulatus]